MWACARRCRAARRSTPGTSGHEVGAPCLDDALDPLIHVAARLKIVATLAALSDGDTLSFTRLPDMIGLTPATCSSTCANSKKPDYIASEKTRNGTVSSPSPSPATAARHSTTTPRAAPNCSATTCDHEATSGYEHQRNGPSDPQPAAAAHRRDPGGAARRRHAVSQATNHDRAAHRQSDHRSVRRQATSDMRGAQSPATMEHRAPSPSPGRGQPRSIATSPCWRSCRPRQPRHQHRAWRAGDADRDAAAAALAEHFAQGRLTLDELIAGSMSR